MSVTVKSRKEGSGHKKEKKCLNIKFQDKNL